MGGEKETANVGNWGVIGWGCKCVRWVRGSLFFFGPGPGGLVFGIF